MGIYLQLLLFIYCRNVSFVGSTGCEKTNLKPDLVVGIPENKVPVNSWAELRAGKACLPDDIHESKKDTETKSRW